MKFSSLLLLAMLPLQASACMKGERTLPENFAQAHDVAFVRILSTRLVRDKGEPSGAREHVEATYEVLESFKGSHKPPVANELVMQSVDCDPVGLLAGNTYVLFIREPGRWTGWLSGSKWVKNSETAPGSTLLTELRAMKQM